MLARPLGLPLRFDGWYKLKKALASLRLARGAGCCLQGSLTFTQQVCLGDRDGSSGVEEPLAQRDSPCGLFCHDS